jgi:L-methionine (R)-S-oxide reductase
MQTSNTANTASLLWHALHSLPSPSSHVNWAGFYTLDPSNPSQLILGPFQGKVACQTIAFGRGVCGAAAQSRKTQLVPDVEKYPGHIACDSDSRSEIVVPIVANSKVRSFADTSRYRCQTDDAQVVAIIDIDSAVNDGFDQEDQIYLEQLAKLLSTSCRWT